MITSALVNSFKADILQGVHQPGDVYRVSLYTARAELGPDTTAYTADGETQGPGYSVGGMILTGYRAGALGSGGFLDWTDPMWPNASITARGLLIYNYSKDNRAVLVVDLGKDYTSTNGSFTAQRVDPSVPLIRIG